MALSALATETKATALITECRRCLSIGVGLTGQFLKDVIDQLQLVTTTDTSGRTDIAPNSPIDGRTAAEMTTAGS